MMICGAQQYVREGKTVVSPAFSMAFYWEDFNSKKVMAENIVILKLSLIKNLDIAWNQYQPRLTTKTWFCCNPALFKTTAEG